MRALHLHLGGWDPPLGAIEIELTPFRMTEFAWAQEDVGGKLQGRPRDWMPTIAINSPEQRANADRIDNRCPMSHLRGGQRTAEVGGRVSVGPTGSNGIPKDGSESAPETTRCFVPSAGFNASQNGKYFWRRDFRYRAVAYRRIDRAEQPALLVQSCFRAPLSFEFRYHLLSDSL